MTLFQDDELAVCNLAVSSAEVSGFVEDKSKRGKEFLFIVDVLWSDGRSCCIRRSYQDFLEFRKKLIERNKKLTDLPKLPDSTVIQMLKWDKTSIAEERESQLHLFVKKLIDGNPLIVSLPLVLNFFEPRPTDPIPYKHHSDREEDEDDPFSEEVFDCKWMKRKK
ncbi:unnamed protein product [Mytilus coruscus]|uniref:PX domain-containing protein n=1 Tax=Mytilus coruscus TaxID=42192 RepID=A0A6J8C783_MYTCO|nr:unnamed protein product [Mytilus coruscus]